MNSESPDTDPDAMGLTMLRYIDGALSSEGIAELNESLRSDRVLRREFAELMIQHALLAEVCKEKVDPPKPVIQLRAWGRNVSWRLWASAAAWAAILIAGWLLAPTRYPPARIAGAVEVVGRGGPKSGAFLYTGDKSGRLTLGGYCRLEIEPKSVLVIEGKRRAEGVLLGRGGVTCGVDQGDGTFTVRTKTGTISAIATKFGVRIFERSAGKSATEMSPSRAALAFAVTVKAGTVRVEYDGKSYELAAGSRRAFGAAGTTRQRRQGRARAEKTIAELHEMLQDARKRAKLPGRGKGRVIGFVIDAETGEPPPGAVIAGFKGQRVVDARPERTGELRGMYELTVDPGTWKIEARAKGYQTATAKDVKVISGHGSGMGAWRIFRLRKDQEDKERDSTRHFK